MPKYDLETMIKRLEVEKDKPSWKKLNDKEKVEKLYKQEKKSRNFRR